MEVDGNEDRDGQSSRNFSLSGIDRDSLLISDDPAFLAGNGREQKSHQSQQMVGQQRYKGFLSV